MLTDILFYLREYFFPSGCAGCGKEILNPEDSHYGLCGDCRAFLKRALSVEKRCGICGKPLISEKETCLSCRAADTAASGSYNEHIAKLRVLFPYTGKFKAILGAYKFEKSLGVGNFLAECLAAATGNIEAIWVPVPPRPGKIKKQGWDQIEYLARRLDKNRRYSGRPVCRCLKRLSSRSQKELNRLQRKSNLKGRILCARQPPRNAIIFDDVVTTGATLNACAKALLEGGAEKVFAVCLFYD